MARGVVLALAAGCSHAAELLGYVENWNDATWWDTSMPGDCMQGCFRPGPFLNRTAPFSAINYGFVFLTPRPNASQLTCYDNPDLDSWVNCPPWDGHSIYISEESKDGSNVIDEDMGVDNNSPGIVAIAETVRLGRMHPAGPKRTKISLGGWSDFARLATDENAVKAAALVAKLVRYTLADGVDIDMEHLSPFAASFPLRDEFGAMATFVVALRKELDKVADTWVASVFARKDAMEQQFSAAFGDEGDGGLETLEDKLSVSPYYETHLAYLMEVASNGVPHLEISWSTRFNAFVPDDDPYNYLKPGTPKPNTTFETDNEGKKLWSRIKDSVDTVNIMAYDASGLYFDYEKVLENFVSHGVPKEKVRTPPAEPTPLCAPNLRPPRGHRLSWASNRASRLPEANGRASRSTWPRPEWSSAVASAVAWCGRPIRAPNRLQEARFSRPRWLQAWRRSSSPPSVGVQLRCTQRPTRRAGGCRATG